MAVTIAFVGTISGDGESPLTAVQVQNKILSFFFSSLLSSHVFLSLQMILFYFILFYFILFYCSYVYAVTMGESDHGYIGCPRFGH